MISMLCALENLSCVCALGRTNDEVLAGLQARSTAGMVPFSSDIPGRTVLFGAVRGELPEIADAEYNTRTNRLIIQFSLLIHDYLDQFCLIKFIKLFFR